MLVTTFKSLSLMQLSGMRLLVIGNGITK